MITKYLKDETWQIIGSSAYNLPNYTPKDIDICILSTPYNTNTHLQICKKLSKMALDNNIIMEIKNRYRLSFDWGGTTYARIKIVQYDIFLADRITFNSIKSATECIQLMPDRVKEKLAKNKQFRVDLFRLIAGHMT